jgi:hypothetical protein
MMLRASSGIFNSAPRLVHPLVGRPLPPRDAPHESSSRKDGTAQKGRYSFQPRMKEKLT